MDGLRRTWERLAEPAPVPSGIDAAFRHQAKRVVDRLHRADRALLGDLVGAVEATAARTDELADRVARLETLVQEVVQVLSDDLVHIRAALATRPAHPPTPPDEDDRPPSPTE